jgi:Predicted hydrolase of the metallo-beta-lactamase superfamily
MHGVNVVMPDTSYLKENQKRIRGMIVTHGHEDHIGGIAHHLKNFSIPVIHGPRLALAMLTGKMEEAGCDGSHHPSNRCASRRGEGWPTLFSGVHPQHPLDGRQLFAGHHTLWAR